MFSFEQTKDGYAHMWDEAKVASAHVDAEKLAHAAAARALAHKAVYQQVAAALAARGYAMPWWAIAPLHYREADFDLASYLGNGEPLSRRTTLVPAGHGPFTGPDAFVDGAVDALIYQFKVLGIAPGRAFTVEFILWFWECFNGQGYFRLNVNSPYLWNWTQLYAGGKYVADHRFDRGEFDVQGGCVAIVKELLALDSAIVIQRENASPIAKKETPVNAPASPASPALGSIDFMKIEGYVELADKFLGTFSNIPGPVGEALKVLHTAVAPALEDALKVAAQFQGGGDVTQVPALVASLLHNVGNVLHPPSAVIPPAAQPA